MSAPTLWHFAISHFTEKARWALDWKGIPHVRQMLFLEYPIRCFLRTGQMRLPVLFQDGKTIVGSSQIIAHVERIQPQPPLYPEDPDERARALALEAFFDAELGPHIRAVVVDTLFQRGRQTAIEAFGMTQSEGTRALMRAAYPIFRPFYRYRHAMGARNIEIGREKVAHAFERLEAEIGASGYLVGDRFSVADLTAAALFYPIAFPAEYPYEFPASFREATVDFVAPFDGSRGQAWVLDIYRRHRGVYAGAPLEHR